MPSPAASANVATELDLLRLERLVHHYDIGELVRHWPATAGIENSNYFLATRKRGVERQYVLTIMEQPANAGDALVPLLDVCVAAGLPVPAVIRTVHGEPLYQLDGKPALLCPRLPGRHVCNPTLRQVEALGRFIARFHLATGAADLSLPDYPRDGHWLDANLRALHGRLPYGDEALMRETATRVAAALERRDVIELPRGTIHGDLFRDNALFNDWGLCGVLDFHHASRGFLAYDLAVAANDWCTESNGTLDPERTLALLRAYHALRPLAAPELWYFPIFALYAALAFWMSREVVAQKQRRGAAVRSNNPDEFRRIVAHHRAHFFYLSPQRLD